LRRFSKASSKALSSKALSSKGFSKAFSKVVSKASGKALSKGKAGKVAKGSSKASSKASSRASSREVSKVSRVVRRPGLADSGPRQDIRSLIENSRRGRGLSGLPVYTRKQSLHRPRENPTYRGVAVVVAAAIGNHDWPLATPPPPGFRPQYACRAGASAFAGRLFYQPTRTGAQAAAAPGEMGRLTQQQRSPRRATVICQGEAPVPVPHDRAAHDQRRNGFASR
jgi:hypothetical protein